MIQIFEGIVWAPQALWEKHIKLEIIYCQPRLYLEYVLQIQPPFWKLAEELEG